MLKRLLFLGLMIGFLFGSRVSSAALQDQLDEANEVLSDFMSYKSMNIKDRFNKVDNAVKAVKFLANIDNNRFGVVDADDVSNPDSCWAQRLLAASEYDADMYHINHNAEGPDKSFEELMCGFHRDLEADEYVNALYAGLNRTPVSRESALNVEAKKSALKYHAAVRFQRKLRGEFVQVACNDKEFDLVRSQHPAPVKNDFDVPLKGLDPLSYVDYACGTYIDPHCRPYAPNCRWDFKDFRQIRDAASYRLGQIVIRHKHVGYGLVALAAYGAYKLAEKIVPIIRSAHDKYKAEYANNITQPASNQQTAGSTKTE